MLVRRVCSLILMWLCLMPTRSQDANAPQAILPQTYTEVATLGRGKVIEAQWRFDGEAFLVSTQLGAWLYAVDFTLLHHFPGIGQSALSPDSRFVATITVSPYQLRIWDAQSYEMITTFDLGPDPAWKSGGVLAWSPDSSHLAVVVDKTVETVLQSVEIFDVVSEAHIRSFPLESYIVHLTWRPDGQRLAVSQFGPLQIIDPFHNQSDTTVSVDAASNIALWSPDQKTLATLWIDDGYGGMENNLKLWSADGKTLKFVIQEPFATTLAWSPDSLTIATGMRTPVMSNPPAHSVSFWDAQTGERVNQLLRSPYRTRVMSIEWSPDGTQMLMASADNLVRNFPLASAGSECIAFPGGRTGSDYKPCLECGRHGDYERKQRWECADLRCRHRQAPQTP